MKSLLLPTLRLTTLAAAAAVLPAAQAQHYPSKPITVVVPYPAGGATDFLSRSVGKRVGERLGQNVVVVNRPGASGAIAAASAARADADGHTILMVTGVQMSVNPFLYKDLQYDPKKDFAPIVYATAMPSVVVVNPKAGIGSLADLIRHAKAEPGRLNYASASNGTPSHLGPKMFEKMTGTSMTSIPYKGGVQALTDLVAGQVTAMFAYIPEAMPFIKAGKLKPLAVTTLERSPLLPEIPTVSESGVRGYELLGYFGFVVPAKTPPEIVQKLNATFNEVLQEPEIQSSLLSQGFIMVGGSTQKFADFIDAESRRWGQIIREENIKAD